MISIASGFPQLAGFWKSGGALVCSPLSILGRMGMRFLVVLFFAVLTGCAANQNNVALQQEAARTVPTCSTADDCEIMWSAARQWVLSNAGYKIQNYGADYFDTYNPTQNSPLLAAQVSKNAVGGGVYKINAKFWCANIFGCQPRSWEALVEFNRAVNAAASR